VKLADTASGTDVRVYVDGVAGALYHSARIGSIISSSPVDLGGRGPKADKDSIDGRYQSVLFTVA